MNEHYDDPRVVGLCKALILAANQAYFVGEELASRRHNFDLDNWMFRNSDLMRRQHVFGFSTRSFDDEPQGYARFLENRIPEFLKEYISTKWMHVHPGKFSVNIRVHENILSNVAIKVDTLSPLERSALLAQRPDIPLQSFSTYKTISLPRYNTNEGIVYFIGTPPATTEATHFFQLGHHEFLQLRINFARTTGQPTSLSVLNAPTAEERAAAVALPPQVPTYDAATQPSYEELLAENQILRGEVERLKRMLSPPPSFDAPGLQGP